MNNFHLFDGQENIKMSEEDKKNYKLPPIHPTERFDVPEYKPINHTIEPRYLIENKVKVTKENNIFSIPLPEGFSCIKKSDIFMKRQFIEIIDDNTNKVIFSCNYINEIENMIAPLLGMYIMSSLILYEPKGENKIDE